MSRKSKISFRCSEFHDSSTIFYFLVIIWRIFLIHTFSSYTAWSVYHLLSWWILQSRKALPGLEIVLYRNTHKHKHMMLIKLRLLLRKLTKHFQKTTTFKEKEFNNLNCQNNLKHTDPCKIDYGLRMLTANVLQNMTLYS